MAYTDAGGFISYDTLTILSGSSLSTTALDVSRKTLMAVQLPTGWCQAGLTFQSSGDNQNYANLHTISGEYAFADGGASGARFLAVDPNYFLGAASIKIRSGTGSSPTNQGATQTVTVVVRQVQM